MKLMLPLLMLVLFLPFSYASIEIVSQLKDGYSLGDNIDFSVKVVPAVTTNALINLTLKCSEKEVSYYKIIAPVYLEEGKEIKIDAMPIKAFSEGLCSIKANLESWKGENLEGITSKEFTISHLLELSFSVGKTDVLPGDTIKVEGTATKRGEAIKDGIVLVTLDDKKTQIVLDKSKFKYELKLDKHIKSGEHILVIDVNDSYKNSDSKSAMIIVNAVPATLNFNLNKAEFSPKETLKLKVNLLDQANDTIEGSLNIKLFREKGLFRDEIIIFDSLVEANKDFEFTFNYSTLPEDYKLISSFDDLNAEETIKILPYTKIEMGIKGDSVFIKNVGNIEYNNKTTVVLEKDGKTYFIDKKIKVGVGEEAILNLSYEVPAGNYTVSLPAATSAGEERVVEKIVKKEVIKYVEKEGSEAVEEAAKTEGEVDVLKTIEIEDNRPFYKKGLRMITGGVTAGAGLLLSRPRSASVIIILIIAGIIVYYNKKRIKRIIEKIREKRSNRF